MSHGIAEIVIPPTEDIMASVTQIMDYFRSEKYDADGNEDGVEDHADWWDWWRVGGRFSGHKLQCSLDPERLKAFYEELTRREVTVCGLRAGKEELQPASQIPMVDALWREWFPGKGDACSLFQHARDQYRRDGWYTDDICTIAEIPERLTCSRLIVAGPHWDKEKVEQVVPVRMLVKEFWNHVEWQDAAFDGLVKPALDRMLAEKLTGRQMKNVPIDQTWLAVTVDFHN